MAPSPGARLSHAPSEPPERRRPAVPLLALAGPYLEPALCPAGTPRGRSPLTGDGVGRSAGVRAINLDGGTGVLLTTTKGRRYLFGTDRPEQMATAVNAARRAFQPCPIGTTTADTPPGGNA